METIIDKFLKTKYIDVSHFACDFNIGESSATYISLFNLIPSCYSFNSKISKQYLQSIFEKYTDLKCLSHKNKTRFYLSESQKFIIITELPYGPDYIIYNIENVALLNEITKINEEFTPKKRQKKAIGNIYTLQLVGSGQRQRLQFLPTKIPKPKIDISLNYNDDFKEYDAHLKTILREENKGIAILHGVPGSGKTYYLRHLLNEVDKKMLFIPPSMVHHITEPQFMKILKNHKKAVLIIEDADNILKKRSLNSTENQVSNLLNLSDGLLSDTMQLQIVCTFNNDLSTIDEAFLRKGRLILEYKFQELTIEKAQKLCDKLGIKIVVKQPLTIADCYNTKIKMSSSMINSGKTIGFNQQ